MNQQNILIKGLIKKKNVHFEIESLRARFKRQLLPTTVIDKIIYHFAILLGECERRKIRLSANISIDTIYVKANDKNDPHVFMAEEDLLFQNNNQLTALQVLKKICTEIGTNYYYYNQKTQTIEDVITYSLKKIFHIPSEREKFSIPTMELLKSVYNLVIKSKIHEQLPISVVFTAQTPYYINSDRDIITLKWTNNQDFDNQKIYEYREINLMEKIVDCKNCAKLYGYSKINYECIFFMRYYDITLEQLANKFGQNQEVTQKQYIHLFTQIALAINDLHSKGIIHRDLKPQNIMFEYRQQNESIENMLCVLIDFDRSKGPEGKHQDPSYYQGTQAFQPPEGTQIQYRTSYDVWQLGFIMLGVLLRKKLKEYSSETKPIDNEQIYKNLINPYVNQAQFSALCPLIRQMIEYVPERRPGLKYVIEVLQNLGRE